MSFKGITNLEMPPTLLETLVRQKKDILNAHWKCCLNCMNWDRKDFLCLQANKGPPIEVLVSGCEKWEDEIPF